MNPQCTSEPKLIAIYLHEHICAREPNKQATSVCFVCHTAAAASQGWVSGVIPDSPSDRACQPNISAASCKTCLESKNATLCITCIQNSKRLNAAASCATCANLTWFQEECATCVRNKGSACTDPGWTCSTACEPDGVTCSTECADDSCNPQQVNLGGELMVLAYGSDQNITGLATAPAGTPQRCCAACRNADGCNGWVFCNDPQVGCRTLNPGACTQCQTLCLNPVWGLQNPVGF